MDAELQKLIEAGKLTTKSAAQLEKLKPGTFCLHKSWGFGRVREWNLLLNQIVIDFASKKSHPMQAQYAAENLTPLAPEHFLARKATDIASVKNLARENPVALVQNILESLDGKASAQQIGEWLIGDVLTEPDDLLARVQSLHTTHIGLTLAKLILDEEKRLGTILPNLPAAKEKRVLQALPAALGPGWTERALHLM